MKRFFLVWGLLLSLLLSGCDRSSTARVKTLANWSFQHNEGTDDYSIFFELLDKNDKPLAADVYIDVRIINDENEEVFTGTTAVTADNYGYYTSQADEKQYLADVRIPAAKIKPGKSSNGIVYLTVYKENIIYFDEVHCEAFSCLPVEEVHVAFHHFPLDLKIQDFMDEATSIIQIQDAQYQFDAYSSQLYITIWGEKISGNDNFGYDTIPYKLYDHEGYMIDSGSIDLSSLHVGDKFKDDSVVIFDVVPGEYYLFTFSE